MPFRDEKVFTDEEWIAAFSFILPPDQAREQGLAFNSLPDYQDIHEATPEQLAALELKGSRSYDGDLLDLLSLVSDSCGERAWRLLGIPPEQGLPRREAFRQRIEEALRGGTDSGSPQ